MVTGITRRARLLRRALLCRVGRFARVAATRVSAEQRRGLPTGHRLRGAPSHIPSPLACHRSVAPSFQECVRMELVFKKHEKVSHISIEGQGLRPPI
jgi:hypothetical protein